MKILKKQSDDVTITSKTIIFHVFGLFLTRWPQQT